MLCETGALRRYGLGESTGGISDAYAGAWHRNMPRRGGDRTTKCAGSRAAISCQSVVVSGETGS